MDCVFSRGIFGTQASFNTIRLRFKPPVEWSAPGSTAAAVAHRLGLCDAQIRVHMPGGKIDINISEGYEISMTGAVTKVAEGFIDSEMFEPLD